jgi:hypothetical protein
MYERPVKRPATEFSLVRRMQEMMMKRHATHRDSHLYCVFRYAMAAVLRGRGTREGESGAGRMHG